ncbi:MAG: hypothetical protein ING64_04640 [Rhodocyclaceae bacterium]|nr:hypothetical protein [Rhodocyclaceae bacterium]
MILLVRWGEWRGMNLGGGVFAALVTASRMSAVEYHGNLTNAAITRSVDSLWLAGGGLIIRRLKRVILPRYLPALR